MQSQCVGARSPGAVKADAEYAELEVRAIIERIANRESTTFLRAPPKLISQAPRSRGTCGHSASHKSGTFYTRRRQIAVHYLAARKKP
jgi:hypothetical protein